MSSSRERLDSLHAILRGMIREEIDQTPGFRASTSQSSLPANIDAERLILGSILIMEDPIPPEGIEVDDFSLDSHRRIFSAIQKMIADGRRPDLVTLFDEMGSSVREIGGAAYLASLTEGLPRKRSLSEYVRIIREKALLRRIIRSCASAIGKAQDQTINSSDIVKSLGEELKGIRKASK